MAVFILQGSTRSLQGVVKEILFQSIINKTDDNDQLEDEGFSHDVSFL